MNNLTFISLSILLSGCTITSTDAPISQAASADSKEIEIEICGRAQNQGKFKFKPNGQLLLSDVINFAKVKYEHDLGIIIIENKTKKYIVKISNDDGRNSVFNNYIINNGDYIFIHTVNP